MDSDPDVGDASAHASRPTSRAMTHGAAALCGIVLCAIPFSVTSVPPMDDVPAHVMVARIVNAYDDHAMAFAKYFAVEWSWVPTTLCYVLLGQLQNVVGPVVDARIYLTLWVLGLFAGTAALARTLGRQDPWLAGLVALPLAFCWYAYKGFLPFVMSMPLFALTLAAWSAGWRPVFRVPVVAGLLAMLFGFHIVGAAAAAAAILLIVTVDVASGQVGVAIVVEAIAVLSPLAVMTARYVLGRSGPQSVVTFASPLGQIVDAIKFTVTTLDDRASLVLALWLLGLGMVAMLHLRDLLDRRSATAAAVVLAVLAVAMPQSLGALWPAGPRLLPFALLFLIAIIDWGRVGSRATIAAGLAVLAGLSWLTTTKALEVDRGYQELATAADRMQPGRRLLPIVNLKTGARFTTPFFHAGTIATLAKGGSNPYVLATPYILTAASPLLYRESGSDRRYAFMLESRAAEDYRGVSQVYDYVLTWAASPDLLAVLSAELELLHSSDNVRLFARRGLAQPIADHSSTHRP